ncbi:IS1 family transposase, partial [Escherichia coli]|nr:IS1 family transposase [Escherichia coli]MDW3548554.1 IS1 family transposase [Escherichia coli]MDW3553399.1 IS1 family transposase [Escherichia coli]
PSISDGRLSYQFSSDGYIRRSVYAYSKSVELHDKVIGHYLNIKHYQ